MFEKNNEPQQNSNEETLNDLLKTDHRKVVESIFDSSSDKSLHLKKGGLFKKIIIFLIVALFLSVSIFSVVFFKFNNTIDTNKITSPDSSNQIVININSASGVSDSGEIEYSVSFKNTEKYAMKNIELVARFPKEFSYISSDLTPLSISDQYVKWNFDKVNSGEEKVVSLKGSLFGQVGLDSILSVSMDYYFESISSAFSSSNSFKVAITKPVVELVVDRSDVFYKGKDIDYKIKIKNNSLKPIKNIKLTFNYPYDFNVSSYSDVPYKEYKGEQAFWIFDLSKKQEDKVDATKDDYYEKIIDVKGVVNSDKISDVNFSLNVGIIPDMGDVDVSDNIFTKEDVIRTTTSGLSFAINPDSQIVTNGNDNISVANINKPYKISFKYKKTNKDLVFKDLRLSVEFLGDDIIDASKITANFNPKTSSSTSNGLSNIVLEWDKNNNPSFQDLSETEKELNFSFNLKKEIPNQFKEGGYYSNVKINLFGKNANSKEEVLLVDNKIFKMVLDSNFVVKSSSIYSKNIKSETKTEPIELDLNLSNSYNNLSGVGVYFTLPDGVEYYGNEVLSKSDKFDYNSETRKVSWVVGSIEPFINNISAKFYVNLTPNKNIIGKYADLTSKINVVYRDSTINKDFSVEVDPIKTTKKVIK